MLGLLLPLITSKCGVGGRMRVFDGGSGEVTNTPLGYLVLFCRDPDFKGFDRILKGVCEELRGSGMLERETERFVFF